MLSPGKLLSALPADALKAASRESYSSHAPAC
jgi:hypothetical protein